MGRYDILFLQTMVFELQPYVWILLYELHEYRKKSHQFRTPGESFNPDVNILIEGFHS